MAVVGSAISQFRIALSEEITQLMGDVEHVFVQPYEQRSATYERSDMPTLVLHLNRASQLADDPQGVASLPVRIDFDIHIHQRLVDKEVFSYTQATYDRLWDIVDYLSARLHWSYILPGVQKGEIEIDSIAPDKLEVQERLDAQGFVIAGHVFLLLNPTRTLNTTEDFYRAYQPDLNAPEIEDTEFDIEVKQ